MAEPNNNKMLELLERDEQGFFDRFSCVDTLLVIGHLE